MVNILSSKLQERLEQKPLPWIQISDEDGVPELYLDNHQLQTWRACEAHGVESFVNGWQPQGHQWSLDLGIIIHWMVEDYYSNRFKSDFNVFQWAQSALDHWKIMKMEDYYGPKGQWHHKGYIELGGPVGLATMMLEYATLYGVENERFRVIGTELRFGKNKEVPLLKNHLQYSWAPFRLYLSGIIDLLMDDGYSIGPMDHKTKSAFGGKNPVLDWELQDGMTGYLYATKQLLRNLWDRAPGAVLPARSVNKIWMNFLQIKQEKSASDRFKRLPLYKTDWQIEQYRLRQISTAARIFQLITNFDMEPFYNTGACNKWMGYYACPFQEVHRQNSRENQLVQLSSSFVQNPIWDPEKR